MSVDLATLAELVRAPAALTVPGDVAAGGALRPELALSSVCLYWAGMALNDYADRHLDAEERPERPIPSGRVRPGQALGLAAGLTVAGLALAGRAGGRRALGTAGALAAVVWAYDLALKDTPAGPAAMAAARGLDVLLGGTARPSAHAAAGAGAPAGRGGPARGTPGAGPRAERTALALAAGAVAAHTFGVTTLSRGEVHGGTAARSATALAATGVAAALAAAHVLSTPPGLAPASGTARARLARVPAGVLSALALTAPPSGATGGGRAGRLAGLGLAAAYAGVVGRAQFTAARRPDAGRTRAAVGRSILGLLPLQAALTAGRGDLVTAGALVAAHPLARKLSRKVSAT
ncbi:SCO3242 family prenyltransferase [Sphaerisporangium sp. TRM90804]|uniref:SCO3242 family prenyltransferase n=1 Tax=Sphaerisporangium sp. TRM90804 TaxID=3031113 RepID=UPI0024478ABF|nr:UbiA family prenyltransferase [Sphaerisporangium sp. TRM90804]MDH2426320.1 UbiA family prenyltransferase [Sphaerisporangium sp. TRM90804]